MLGALRAKVGDSPKALQAYSNALQMQSDAATFTARGWVFLANESAALALDDFEKAIQRDRHNAEAYAGRGLIRARQGKAMEAVADAKLAREHGGPTPPARLLWNIAHVYAQIAADTRTKAKQAIYQRRAVDMLAEAIELVPEDERHGFWREFVAPDDLLLVPLRGNVLFDNLEKTYGKQR
jgi:tetratricopeptide (TPR) repeat protein